MLFLQICRLCRVSHICLKESKYLGSPLLNLRIKEGKHIGSPLLLLFAKASPKMLKIFNVYLYLGDKLWPQYDPFMLCNQPKSVFLK